MEGGAVAEVFVEGEEDDDGAHDPGVCPCLVGVCGGVEGDDVCDEGGEVDDGGAG